MGQFTKGWRLQPLKKGLQSEKIIDLCPEKCGERRVALVNLYRKGKVKAFLTVCMGCGLIMDVDWYCPGNTLLRKWVEGHEVDYDGIQQWIDFDNKSKRRRRCIGEKHIS